MDEDDTLQMEVDIPSDVGAECTIPQELKKDEFNTNKAEIKKDYSNQKHSLVPSSMPNQNVVTEPTNQNIMGEDEIAGLLLASVGWDDSQLDLLDSLLDSL